MNNFTQKFIYKESFDSLLAFTQKIFNEKNIFFEDEDSFWFVRIMVYYLARIFVDNKNKKSDSEFKRVIINLPPRHYKSLVVSVIFPAWILGQDPSSQIIIASHNRRLSSHHITHCKMIVMHSPTFQEIFSHVTVNKKCNRTSEFKVESNDEKNGGVIAASIASGAIGFGADFIITDDPHNPSDVYSKNRLASTTNSFKHNIFSRLNDQKTSSMIVVMQRLHVDDLTGNLLKNNNWNQLSLPLINQVDQVFKIFDKEISIRKGDILHADIFDLKTIDDLRADIGLHNFDAQYQQSPNARDFSMVNEDMIRYYDNNSEENFIENNKQNFIENHSKNEEIIGNSNVFHEISSTDCKNCQKNALFEKNNPKQYIENFSKPSENALKCDVKKHDFSSNGSNDTQLRWSNRKIIHSWDTANSAQKNNFTVGTTWEIKDDHYYLIDLYRDQVDYVDLKKNVINQHEKYGGIILIEDKASGSALIQDLSTTTDLSIIKCTPLVSKESRLLKVLHFFERGEIFFPKNARWLEDLKNELLRFPHSKYDDQVDSITQFFLWAEKQRDKIRVIDKRISLMGM